MATATELLRLVIDADGRGAIQGLERVGAASDRELGKIDGRLDRVGAKLTSFGAAAVTAGGVAAAGLFRAAQAAGDLEASIATTEQVFGSAAQDIARFADTSANRFGLSKRAANEAAVAFGAFGKRAGLTGDQLSRFSLDLVSLASDLAAFKNTTTDEAITAITSGLAGEQEPLKRYALDVSDAALKQEFLNQTGEKFTGVLSGQQKALLAQSTILSQAYDLGIINQFQREQGQLAVEQAKLRANFEDALAGLGEAALPGLTSLASGFTNLLDKFSTANEATDGLAGKLATFATAGTIAVGGLSLVAGQAIKLRDAFSEVGNTGERSLNRAGKAAVGLGVALGTVAASDIVFDLINRSTDQLGEFEDAINRVKIAAQDGNDTLEAFAGAVAAEQNTLRIQNIWEEFGAEVSIVGQGVQADLEQVQRAFDSLAASDPAFAATVLNDLEQASASLDRNSEQYRINKDFIDSNRESLRLQSEASQTTAGGIDNLSDSLEGQKSVTEQATVAWREYADTIRASTDPFFAALDASEDLAGAQSGLAEAFAALGDGATAEELATFTNAQREAVQSGLDLQVALAELRLGIEDGSASFEQASGVLDSLQAQFPELAGSIGQARTEFRLAEEAANSLEGDYTVNVQANVDEALNKVRAVKVALDALTQAQQIAAFTAGIAENNGFGGPSVGRSFRRRAAGGPVMAGETVVVGERGPELFQPRVAGSVTPNTQLAAGPAVGTINVYSTDPVLTATEVVRRQRDAAFLNG
jgi:hypothetical protein